MRQTRAKLEISGAGRRRQPVLEQGLEGDPRGLRLAAGAGLELDVDAEAELGAERQRVGEGRHPLALEGRSEPRAGVELAQLRERGERDLSLAAGGPVEAVVVEQHRMAVPGQLDVELDPGRSQLLRLAQAREGVRRCAAAPRWPITGGKSGLAPPTTDRSSRDSSVALSLVP